VLNAMTGAYIKNDRERGHMKTEAEIAMNWLR
jgi:hypothetical protein